MSVRDFLGGVASLFLLLAKIILCLLFAIYDRLIDGLSVQEPRLPHETPRERLPAIEGR